MKTIYSDSIVTLWSYGYLDHSGYSDPKSKIQYSHIKCVCQLGDTIMFAYNTSARTYHKMRRTFGAGSISNIAMLSYGNNLFEIFYKSIGPIRVDIYDIHAKQYSVVNKYYDRMDRKNYDTLIRNHVGHQIDHSKIVYAEVIYDRSWPNYIIDRNAYCDIIITCSS